MISFIQTQINTAELNHEKNNRPFESAIEFNIEISDRGIQPNNIIDALIDISTIETQAMNNIKIKNFIIDSVLFLL